MKFRLNNLSLTLNKDEVSIPFDDVAYFWGQMGAGKTSIARLIDYCLGADIELTPALQSEFVTSTLSLSLEASELTIERPRDSGRVIAGWTSKDGPFHLNLPAADAGGEVIPNTGVENLSDLLFWLSGIRPPRVRRRKAKQESETARLSMRDLLWYCYLDQDEIDSSFFHLDESAHPFKKLKSRDVLRYVAGFHNERVAELETALDEIRGERLALSLTIENLLRVLREVGASSEEELRAREHQLRARADAIANEIQTRRSEKANEQTVHATDTLRVEAQRLGEELARLDAAQKDIREVMERDRRHLHEIQTLSLKFRRSVSAKAILSGVAFESCPRCTQPLPEREASACLVCGQADAVDPPNPAETAIIERDIKARTAELADIIERHEAGLKNAVDERGRLAARKTVIERERNEVSAVYDTAYLSTMLSKERERAALQQEADGIASLVRLPKMLEEQRVALARAHTREQTLRTELREAREAAESDDTNIKLLKDYFLDCLIRSGVPGITAADRVEIPLPSFFPVLYGPPPNDKTITSFATLSSGGKKTLFKCCFAIAVHRLAAKVKAPLPELLIIDSPMKNISERENRSQFEGFYRLVYELASDELKATQFILIDKEFSPPDHEFRLNIKVRQMRPNDPEHPPLIPNYVGK
jgi:hypothetical protein